MISSLRYHGTLVVLTVITVLFSTKLLAESTDDPVAHFMAQESLYQSDEVYEVRGDLNDDGFEDVLLSSSSEDRKQPRGIVIWDYYLSEQGNAYLIPDYGNAPLSLALPKYGVTIARLDEVGGRTSLLQYRPTNASEGSLTAYYFEGTILRQHSLGQRKLRASDGRQEDIDYYNSIVEGSTRPSTVRTTMRDLLTDSDFDALLPERALGFFDYYNTLSNPDDPAHDLVQDAETLEIVGHYDRGVLTPLPGVLIPPDRLGHVKLARTSVQVSDTPLSTTAIAAERQSANETSREVQYQNSEGASNIRWFFLFALGVLVFGSWRYMSGKTKGQS